MLKELDENETLQVGDVIIASNAFGTNKHIVFDVTKKYAKVKNNEVSIGRYPSTYKWDFQRLPKERWNMTRYKVFREVTQD